MNIIKKAKQLLFDRKKPVKLPANYVELTGVQPNYAIGNSYQRALTKMVRAMMADVIPAVLEEYKRNQAEITNIVGDSAIDDLYHIITIKMGNWQRRFALYANGIANNFVDKVDDNVNYQFTKSISKIKDVSDPLYNQFKIQISADTQRIILSREAAIKENVGLITNITPKAEEQIHTAVMAASSRGRDAAYLKQELLKIDGITQNRAKLIARDQLNKVTSVLNAAKQANLGIQKSLWKHSNAGKTPRQSHVQANNKVYLISEGCLIDGEYIYPGQLINCRCYSAPILEFN